MYIIVQVRTIWKRVNELFVFSGRATYPAGDRLLLAVGHGRGECARGSLGSQSKGERAGEKRSLWTADSVRNGIGTTQLPSRPLHPSSPERCYIVLPHSSLRPLQGSRPGVSPSCTDKMNAFVSVRSVQQGTLLLKNNAKFSALFH